LDLNEEVNMSDSGNLIPEFVEESLEHLENIEEDIIIIEQGCADNELINRVFRVVYSIKRGSSFLGLKNIEMLSHKMEDIINLVRNDELEFTPEISSRVLRAVDKLKDMLRDSEESDNYDIEENLTELKKCLEQKAGDKIAQKIKGDIEETAVKIDKSTFDSLRKQGKKVYLVQFELMDESLGGKNPLDFLNEIEKTGDILVKNVNMELVLKDEAFTGEGIPLGILYASVLEKDLVAHILGIDGKKIKEVKPDSLIEEEVIEDAQAKGKDRKIGYLTDVETYLTKGEPEEEELPFRKAKRPGGARRSRPPKEEGKKGETGIEFEEEKEDADVLREINEYLTFLVGDEEYGVGITQIREIAAMHEITPITPLPGSEAFTRGIINLKGDIIPVFDFRLRFKFEERPHDDETAILIMTIKNKKSGVIVDRVSGIIQFSRDQISETPRLQRIPCEYVIGIGRKDGKYVTLLKLKEIFRIGSAA
jgi:purine-binding chemotaxis protein CheW